MQIEAEIGGEALQVENVAQKLAVAGTEQDRMAPDSLVAAVGSEIPDEQAHRVARPVEPAVRPPLARGGGDQTAVGPG